MLEIYTGRVRIFHEEGKEYHLYFEKEGLEKAWDEIVVEKWEEIIDKLNSYFPIRQDGLKEIKLLKRRMDLTELIGLEDFSI